MIKKILPILGFIAASGLATASTISINDFSNLNDGNAYFEGSWGDGSEGIGPGLTQNSGTFTIANVTSTANDGLLYYFGGGATTIDFSADGLLTLTAKLGANNTATQLVFDLLDASNGGTYEATFNLSGFNTSTFTTQSAVLSYHGGSLSNTNGFSIFGLNSAGALLNISLDQLSASSGSAVPEPSTYAAWAGAAALGLALFRTRRRRRLARMA